ncbi:MAG: serine protein kinase RIO [Nitrososphaera sp.]|jgi:RIO kinase 1
MIEQDDEYEITEDDQRGEANEAVNADRQFAKLERENRLLDKKSEDYQVFNNVFDKPTLMAITKLINNGRIKSVRSQFGSGKESQVFLAEAPDGSLLALKIYLTVSAEFRKRRQYIQGDRRFSRTKSDVRSLVSIWANKEFKNLQSAYRCGVSVPAPVLVKRNLLLMKFIGDSEGNAAVILAHSPVVSIDDYNEIIEQMQLLYQKAGLVHADLSEYNIFKTKAGKIVLFDFGSAVDIQHPNAKQLLIRDIVNVNRFFEKNGIGVLDVDSAMKKICGADQGDCTTISANLHFQSELEN